MKPKKPFAPQVETLDDRTLPSVSLSGGVLTVIGTPQADNIQVSLASPTQLRVTVDTSGADRIFGTAAVDSVVVLAGAGNDRVSIAANVRIPVEVRAGAGNDRVNGGGGADYMLGGAGADFLCGRGGDDELFGGRGGDRLYGDLVSDISLNGFDYLVGGYGNDFLSGGYGNDGFVLGLGFDDIAAGYGMDEYFTQSQFDPSPIPFTTDLGLSVFSDDYWQTVDFNQYSDPWSTGYDPYASDPWSTGYDPWSTGYDPWLGGYDPWSTGYDPYSYDLYSDFWSYDLPYSDPYSIDFGSYNYWSQYDLSTSFSPSFFDNLGFDAYVLGDAYRPVRTINDAFVLTTNQSATSVQQYDNGYQIRTFTPYQEWGATIDNGSLQVGTITEPDQIPLPVW